MFKTKFLSYRWVILMMTWALLFVSVVVQFQIAGLAYRIIPDLGLTASQFSMVLTAPMFAGVCFSFISGALADKYGVMRVVGIGFAVSIAAGFFRHTADSFWPLLILMFLSGIGPGFLNANGIKLLGAWFPKEKMGTVMGLFNSASGVGITVALASSALFPTTKSAYLAANSALLAVWILWLALVKAKPEGAPDLPAMPVTKYIGIAARSKNVWLVGLALMFFMGYSMVFSGFLSNALSQARGLDPVTAGVMASMVTFGTIIGSVLGPFLSDRVGSVKPFLLIAAALGAISGYGAWVMPPSSAMSVLLVTLGIFSGVCSPLLMSFPMRLPEIGPAYAGSAGGIITTLQVTGAVFIPTFIIAPLAGQNFNLLFALGSLSFLMVGVVAILLPELGTRDAFKADSGYSAGS